MSVNIIIFVITFTCSLLSVTLQATDDPTVEPTVNPTTLNVISYQQYCATFNPNQADNATGYFALEINNGVGIYQFEVDLTHFESLGSCSLSNSGLNWYIYSSWANTSAAASAGSSYCNSNYTGGHYDPNYACSTSSQNSNSLCNQLQRTSSNGYVYTCNPTVYGSGNYSEWLEFVSKFYCCFILNSIL